jgi:FMN phosphatase YigB (HAD superfamily)
MKIKPNQIILFDIDKTLHSTDEFRSLFKKHLLEKVSIDEKKLDEARKKYDASLKKRTFFHPKKMAKHLANELGIDKNILQDSYYQEKNFENSLFNEANAVLKKIGRKNILGVFTEGYKDLQTRKLKHGKIDHHFNEQHLYIFFNKRTKRVLDLIPKDAVIIDDNPEIIDILLKRPDLTVIWLNRDSLLKHPQAYTIHSLSELLLLV